jgi:hypothetical protein
MVREGQVMVGGTMDDGMGWEAGKSTALNNDHHLTVLCRPALAPRTVSSRGACTSWTAATPTSPRPRLSSNTSWMRPRTGEHHGGNVRDEGIF